MQPFDPFEDQPRLAVAISGGCDSLSLAILAHEWVVERKGKLTALTVDHGLRPESLEEAHQVSKWLAEYNIEHVILPWKGVKPLTGIQESARHARYALLENWCQQQGYLHLLLGHHQEDQAETILMRAIQHSGLLGLAGMSALVEKPQLRLLRPLLSIPKERLRQALIERRQAWLEDPSNVSDRFQRSIIRKMSYQFRNLPVDVLTCHPLLQKYRQSFEMWLNEYLSQEAQISPLGFALLNRHSYLNLPEEMQVPVLLHILKCVGVGKYPPKSSALHLTLTKIKQAGFKAVTCHGVQISTHMHNLTFTREWRRVTDRYDALMLSTMKYVYFDQRFEVKLDKLRGMFSSDFHMSKVGEEGWKQLISHFPTLKDVPWPKSALWSLPAAWRGTEILLEYNMISEWLLTPLEENIQPSFIFRPLYPFTCFIFAASS